MRRNKGFTLVELIIVIAIVAIIMLIGGVAYGEIVFRQKVSSDKATGSQIGKAINVAEADGKGEDIPDYPNIIKYDEIEGIENYIKKGIVPQSAPEGYYFVTRMPTAGGRKTVVGIGTGKDEGEIILNKVYNGKETGLVYTEGKEISKFLEEEGSEISEGTIMPSGGETGVAGGETIIPLSSIEIGSYIAYTPSSISYTVPTTASGHTSAQTYNSSTYSEGWQVFKNNSGQIDIISAESIGSLTLKGATGYAKAVKTLNDLSKAYKNPTYADEARSIGYDGAVDEITTPLTWAYTYSGSGSYGGDENVVGIYDDTTYLSDKSIIDANTGLRHSSGYVWLASRKLLTDGGSSGFYVRRLYRGGSVDGTCLYDVSSVGSGSVQSKSNGVRPVISLKSEIQISGGSGTEADPYRISI